MRSTFKVLFYVNKSKEKDGILWNREIHKLPLLKSFCFFFLTKNQRVTLFEFSIGNDLETS